MLRRALFLAGALVAVLCAVTASAQASGWSVKATPTIAGGDDVVLNGVSCANAAACAAVGTYLNPQGSDRPLAEIWDGHTWTQQSVPIPSSQDARFPTEAKLYGVSCTGPDACTVVGWFFNVPNLNGSLLVERWNGVHWTRETAATPAEFDEFIQFNAVSCISATNCTAVGDYDQTGELERLELDDRSDP